MNGVGVIKDRLCAVGVVYYITIIILVGAFFVCIKLTPQSPHNKWAHNMSYGISY